MSQTALMYHGERPEDRFYAKHSTVQRSVIQRIEGILFRFLDISSWTDSSPELFTICDYGCADGHNSAEVIHEVITKLSDHYRESTVQFQVIYEDRPENDFRRLFHHPTSVQEAAVSPKFLLDLPNVFLLATGNSFYNQCLPPNSVDIAMCFTAMHWLSHTPCPIKDAVFPNFTENADALKRFEEQAARDLETFLLKRATELKPGGRLFLTVPCRDGVGVTAVKDEKGFNVFEILHKVLHEMEESKKLTRLEAERVVLGIYCRSKAEIEKPFLDPTSAVCESNLQLVGLEYVKSPDSFMEQWKNEDDLWSAASRNAHGERVTSSMKAFMLTTIIGALDATRTSKDKGELVDQVFLLFQEIVTANPDKVAYAIASYVVSIRKLRA